MVDENADRVHVPGQHGVPERDIEPLWPPDQIDGFGASGWDAPPPAATPPGVHPVTPPGVHPMPSATQSGMPGGHPAAVPPSPADYPSLTGGGPPATGWEPAAPTDPDPGVSAGPDSGLYDSAWGPRAAGSAGAASGAAGRAAVPVGPLPESGQVDLDLPFTLDPPTSLAPDRDSGPRAVSENAPADAGNSLDAPADTTADRDDAAPTTRLATESPWAQPPQRSTSGVATPPEPGERAGAADRAPLPTWAAPAQPLPPVPSSPPGTPLAGTPLPGTPVPSQPGPHQPVVPPLQHGDPVPHAPVAQHGTAQHGTLAGHDASVAPVLQPGPPPFTSTAQVPPPAADVGPPAAPQPGLGAPQVEPPYATPPGPFPPQPAWQPAAWQQQGLPAVSPPVPQRPYPPTETASRTPPGYAEQGWSQETGGAPTAEDFARRRQVRPTDPVATMGVRAVVNKTGLVKLPPGRHELETKRDIEMVRRNFGGLRQVTVVNPKGGAGKTVAILLLAMTFGQKRGGYVLAWDNNETQGTLGMRAQQDFHSRTVRDLLRDLGQFHGAHGRVGDLSQYVRSQGEGMFDVLASDESATGGEMLTAAAFGEIREVVSRFYKLIFVDTGNNVRAQNWQAAMDATDQLVVTMSARNDSAETAARMLDHLEQSGRQRLVRQAVTVVSMPPSRKEIDLPAIQEHFAARTRAVLLAPYERLIDTGEPIRYAGLSAATRDAWLKIAAAVAEGL
ncbi:chromosome partitioning protein [Micromonospora sp. NPDC051196]|uniref:MinD/ParA family ATP-binding protein n=1 Tax=Micromonospora sp. NPDC051196 TaxID=3155281 RepID=UPI0034300678